MEPIDAHVLRYWDSQRCLPSQFIRAIRPMALMKRARDRAGGRSTVRKVEAGSADLRNQTDIRRAQEHTRSAGANIHYTLSSQSTAPNHSSSSKLRSFSGCTVGTCAFGARAVSFQKVLHCTNHPRRHKLCPTIVPQRVALRAGVNANLADSLFLYPLHHRPEVSFNPPDPGHAYATNRRLDKKEDRETVRPPRQRAAHPKSWCGTAPCSWMPNIALTSGLPPHVPGPQRSQSR